MERECGKCKGEGGRATRRLTTASQWFSGDSGWKTCDVCHGSKINPNYRETRCEKCSTTIGYHKDSKFPPKYCVRCKEIVQRERAQKQQERERENAKWREKRCSGLQGSYCGNTIKYRIDWDKIPDICPSCREKAKAAKQQREKEWSEKRCKRTDCPNMVRINIKWDKPPDYCKTCSDQRIKVNSNASGTLQAFSRTGELLFTFSRCKQPPANRSGEDIDRKREWARRGYWWVALPYNPHETFILSENPVVDGFLKLGPTMDISFSSAGLRLTFSTAAIMIANSVE